MKVRKKPSGNCKLCGIFRNVLCKDHVIPKHLGGGNEPSNIQFICANCHQDKTASELRALSLNRKLSKQHVQKISDANMGHSVSLETRAKISAGWEETPNRGKAISAAKSGHTVTEETRQKIRDKLKGRPLSPDHKARVCAAIARRFDNAGA